MGLLGKIKKAIGAKEPQIQFEVSAPGYDPGDKISGSVLLIGTDRPVKIHSILLQFVHTSACTVSNSWDTFKKVKTTRTVITEQFLSHKLILDEEQRIKFPLNVEIPADIFPSSSENQYSLSCLIKLEDKKEINSEEPIHIITKASPDMIPQQETSPQPDDDRGTPSIGERVLALYEENWYEGIVGDIGEYGIQIKWFDGTDSWVASTRVLPSETAVPTAQDLAIGQIVMAKWDEAFFESSVIALEGDQAKIHWDDGTKDWVKLEDIRLL